MGDGFTKSLAILKKCIICCIGAFKTTVLPINSIKRVSIVMPTLHNKSTRFVLIGHHQMLP